MTCTVIREEEGEYPGRVVQMIFTCDHKDGCDASPTEEEIKEAGSLMHMGWECPGGKHYCPKHRLTPREGIYG